MAQHDYNVANQSGAAFRQDLNNALAAIVSNNSGAVEPSTTYAYQFWADTTAGVLKQRNAANSAWVTLFQLDGEWTTIALENGTGAAPSLYFKDSGTDTGLYSPGIDQVGVSTAGVQRVNFNGATEVVFNDTGADVDFRIEGDTEPNLFVVDAGTDQVRVKNLNGGPLAGDRNRIINGDCRIAQRGALSITGNSTPSIYGGCDRITGLTYGFTTATGTLQQSGSGFGAFGVSQAIVGLTTTGSGGVTFGQRIEANNCKDLNSTSVTVQAKVWQNTGSSQTLNLRLNKANSADNFSAVTVISTSSNFTIASSTLTTVTATFTLGASDATNGILVEAYFSGLGALSSKDFHITDFQLEQGSVATPFERRSYGQELALCQRYYEEVGAFLTGMASTSTLLECQILFNQKRTNPSISQISGRTARIRLQTGVLDFASSNPVIANATAGPTQVWTQVQNFSGLIANYPATGRGNGDNFIAVIAEL